MKTHHTITIAVLLALGSAVHSQDSAASPAQTEMQKWIATTDAQWQAVFAREVTAPLEAEQVKLWQQYLGAVEAAIAKATGAADLDLAVAWRKERDRFSSAKDVPAEDEVEIIAAIKQLRAGWRVQNAKIQKDRAEHAKAVHSRCDQVLAQAQAKLTQAQRLDDALLVKAKREEIAAAWLPPVPPGTSPTGAVSAMPKSVVPAPKTTRSADGLAKVDAQGMVIAPLAKDGKLWSDRDVLLVKIPAKFKDYQFTQAKAHGLTLQFKVLADGLVYMGCSTRWGSTAAPDVAKGLATAETLKKAGWMHVAGVEITTTANDMSWTIFSRQCRAGEEFTYRTEKYAPPILLVK